MLVAALALAARAEEAAPPLIDLDGTFFVQLGLFLLLLVILSKTLFGPYLKMRDAREQGIGGARREAGELGEQARGIVEAYDQKLVDAKRRGADERNRLRLEANGRERELLGKARADAQAALEVARKRITQQTALGRSALASEAGPLARKVASRVLGREVA